MNANTKLTDHGFYEADDVAHIEALGACYADQPLDQQALNELNLYQSHSLDSLQNAALMERVDSKFLLPKQALASLLADMRSEYSVLQIDNERTFEYVTTYYDTPTFDHYMAHHNGRPDRFKIRKRTYTQSEATFLEVKFKDRLGRCTKTRIPNNTNSMQLSTTDIQFLAETGVPVPETLNPVMTGVYRRVSLANEALGERLTIDYNLSFQDELSGNTFEPEQFVIVELKQGTLRRDAAFFNWAKKNNIRQNSFSKYCMGIYFTGLPELKRNRFHSIARQIVKHKQARPNQ